MMKNLIKKILKESEEDDLSWIDSVDLIIPGSKFKVLGDEYPNEIILSLTINDVFDKDGRKFIDLRVDGGYNTQVDYDSALNLIKDKYWIPHNNTTYHYNKWRSNNLKESEDDGLDWIRDVKPTLLDVLTNILTNVDDRFEITHNTGYDSNSGDEELSISDAYDGGTYFYIDSEEPITIHDVFYEAKDNYDICLNNNKYVGEETRDQYRFIYDQIRNYLNITESIRILNTIKLPINEDGKNEPDMVWDFPEIKKKIDLSKTWVKTKDDVIKYLNILLDRFKLVPLKVRLKLLKYVTYSFLGILTLSQITDVEEQVKSGVNRIELKAEVLVNKAKKVFNHQKDIRKPSEALYRFLKYEEGLKRTDDNSGKVVSEPVLTAYDIGDGAKTIGYGHAVFSDPSRGDNGGGYDFLPKYNKIITGKTRITPEQAETLLRDDVEISVEALNKILDDWSDEDIKPKITQNMYNAMVSMIYNMGIGNFRKSETIQLVKMGKFSEAKEQIKKESNRMFNKYPGLKIRRERESNLFGIK